jgi:predicted glutamine amidotransferase
MCELMGLSLQRAISASFSVREFGGRDEENADGWGLAWYPDRSAALVKEPVPWRASAHTKFLAAYPGLQSAIYVAHVRHKTVGGQATHADTHPFLRELGGRDYIFAHNGTLVDLPQASVCNRFHALGATDSERAFCLLLERIEQRQGALEAVADFRWLSEELARLNAHGKLNCLVSDGRSLFCYRDCLGRGGLAWRSLSVPAQQHEHFGDREVDVAFESPETIRAVIVATQPLDASEWHDFLPGELMVLQEGRVAFSSRRLKAGNLPLAS